MQSKQTDYVNAQFEDAESRISDLFKKIHGKEKPNKSRPIACDYCYMTWGWFGWSWIRGVYIWKEKNKIHMVAMVCAWKRNTGNSSTTGTISVKSWGIPPRRYGETKPNGNYAYVVPEANGVHIEMGTGPSAQWDMPIIIEASWNA